jgi:copper homeostasis protein
MVKVELCSSTLEAVLLAKELKIDRIELCQNLEQGGLTPSFGMIEYALELGLETHVLIRPRAAGFCYSKEELKVIFNDIISCKNMGVEGIVIGILKNNFEIDQDVIKHIKSISGDMSLTFHRAFDETIDWKRSMDILIAHKFKRILTSGFCSNVEQGFTVIKEMIAYSNNRIEIMPGGGISSSNVKRIIEELKPNGIHFSATVKTLLDEDSAFSETVLRVDSQKVNRILTIIRA